MQEVAKIAMKENNKQEPPKSLWLQWNGAGDENDPGEVCEGEVTWARDQIFAGDVCYVREDITIALIQSLRVLTTPCTRSDFTAAKLDEVVSNIAKTALSKYYELRG